MLKSAETIWECILLHDWLRLLELWFLLHLLHLLEELTVLLDLIHLHELLHLHHLLLWLRNLWEAKLGRLWGECGLQELKLRRLLYRL